MKPWTVAIMALLGADAVNLKTQTVRREAAEVQTEAIDSFVSLVESDMLTNRNVFVKDGFQVSELASGPAPAAAPGPAPAAAPGPAPALAPAPAAVSVVAPATAPVVVEAPTTATTSAAVPTGPTTKITQKITGIDYDLLMSDEKLRADFERSVRVVLAAEAGVTESDVTLELSKGSVIVTATVAVPEGGTAAVSPERVKEKVCGSKHLRDEMVAALSNLDGMGAAASGEIKIDEQPSECPAPTTSAEPTTSAAPAKTAAPSVPNVTATAGGCNPGCMADRGICGGSACFCKHPYTGVQCELEIAEEFMRFNYFSVTVIVIVAITVGFFLADLLWKICRPSPKADISTGAPKLKKETWAPGGST